MSNDPDLLMLVADVGRMLRTEIDRRARCHSMTRAQWVILLRLSRQPGMSQKELAELLEVEPITVARLADRLESRGLLERRHDPNDRRMWRLHLTPEAQPILQELTGLKEELAERVTAKLDRATIDAAIRALQCMRATLSKRCDAQEAA